MKTVSLIFLWMSAGLSFAQALQPPPSPRERLGGFDISRLSIPRGKIRQGGPAKDGIPSIDAPTFASVASTRNLQDEEELFVVSLGGDTRGYPLRILVWHEIVNDIVDEKPVAVTYCPLCGTAMAFLRGVEGKTLSFGVSGLLYESDVLMFDRETESLWSQLKMEAVSGDYQGKKMEWITGDRMTWAAFRRAYPKSKVLTTDTGHHRAYGKDPYAGYEKKPGTYFPVTLTRRDLPEKEWVIGLLLNGQSRAYPLEKLRKSGPLREKFADQEITVSIDPKTGAVLATSADGKRLPLVQVYWFAWQAFYPKTEVWQPTEMPKQSR